MKRGRIAPACILAAAVLCAVGIKAVAQQPAGAQGQNVRSVREYLGKGQFKEALAAASAGLKADPRNSALTLCKIDALLGMHQCVQARSLALKNISRGPAFRFKAGQASASVGRTAEALRFWKPLLNDAKWAGAAYRESVLALLALGKEGAARALVHKGVEAHPQPELLALATRLDGDAGQVKRYAAELKGEESGSLKRLVAAADGALCSESLEGKLPGHIKVKEKSEQVEIASLRWGSSAGAGSTEPAPISESNPHSGTQGFGAGFKDRSSTEGTKTGTMRAAPRPVVEAVLNDKKKEYMVLDSAGENVLLSPKVAKSLDLELLGEGAYGAIGLSAPVPSRWVLIKKMEVGPLTFANVPALVISDKAVFWNETGGVLPLWLFRHYALHYDRRHSRLTVYPSGTSADGVLGRGAIHLKPLWYGNSLYVETRIQSHPFCYLKVATANAGSYVEARRAGDLGLELATARHGPQNEQALFGIINSGVAENATLDLGTTRINLPRVLLANLCPDRQVDCCGVLGRNILDLFDVFIDYEAGVVALKGYEKGR